MPAVHEAGHAVVAAYLRVPFTHVTIKPGERLNRGRYDGYIRTGSTVAEIRTYSWNQKTDTFRRRSDEEIAREFKRQVTNRGIVLLAARAAVEMPDFNWRKAIPEDCYKGDENDLVVYAGLKACTPSGRTVFVIKEGDFQVWRTALLQRAQEIVAIPYVLQAIQIVASELELEYSIKRKGLPSIEVRRALRWAEAKSAATGTGSSGK